MIFKSPLVSTVRRSAHYDCVTVVTPAGGAGPQMIHVFLGLITNAEDGTVGRVPVVRRRIAEILLRSGVRADSHTGRRLLAALRTLPRDELLEAPTADLLRLAQLVVDRADRHTVGVFARIHLNRDFVSVLVYFPADRFGPETRRKVTAVISQLLAGRDHRPRRPHRRAEPGPHAAADRGAARRPAAVARARGSSRPRSPRSPAAGATTSPTCSRSPSARTRPSGCCAKYARRAARGLQGGLRRRRPPSATSPGSRRCRAEDGLAFDLYTPDDDDEADRRLKVFRTGQAVSLARALPIFTQMGIEVLDERPYEIDLADGETVWIYDFGLRLPAGIDLRRASGPANMIDAVRLLWLEPDRAGRLQRARRPHQHDVVAGQRPARLREVPAPGRHDRSARATSSRRSIDNAADRARRSSSCSSRASTRPRATRPPLVDGEKSRVDDDRGDARRRRQPRPGPHPALAARPGERHAAHQRLPHRRRRATGAPRSR